jgi:hypothetical protein
VIDTPSEDDESGAGSAGRNGASFHESQQSTSDTGADNPSRAGSASEQGKYEGEEEDSEGEEGEYEGEEEEHDRPVPKYCLRAPETTPQPVVCSEPVVLSSPRIPRPRS